MTGKDWSWGLDSKELNVHVGHEIEVRNIVQGDKLYVGIYCYSCKIDIVDFKHVSGISTQLRLPSF